MKVIINIMDDLVKFSQVEVGTVFFDRVTGLLFHKKDDISAVYVKNYSVVVEFAAGHMVEPYPAVG